MIALVATSHLIAIVTLVCFMWRFPVPFSWVLAYVPWMVCFVWGHVVVLRGRLFRSRRLRNRLLLYLPLLSLQVSQIVLYPAYSALFEAAGFYEQFALIAFFPLLKYGLQRSMSIMAHHFHDFALEEGVYSVEISASMYQSMIMQMSPSPLAIALVIGLDLAIGFHDVRRFMDRAHTLPRAQLVASAFHLLEDDGNPIEDDNLVVFASERESSVPAKIVKGVKKAAATLPGPFIGHVHTSRAVVPSTPSTVASKRRSLSSLARNDRMVITQALEILQSAECILVVEYLEVVVPIVNAVYLAVASQLPSAIYNPKIRSLYHNQQALQAAMSSILLYSTLQGVTFVIMCTVMRLRFRLSALTLLAFLLQGRAWSLQGKMLAWVPFTFAFSVIHYGVDFTFKFDFKTPPQS